MPYLFTSESVSEGHPDKVADQISDALIDHFMAFDPTSKVACETLVTTGQVVLAGEVKSEAYLDVQDIAREVIREIGYTKSEYMFEANSCGIFSAIHEQSPDINQGVERKKPEEQGAGDQGMMFGYASRETDNYMPLPLDLSHRILLELAAIRKTHADLMPYLRPDAKSQVTLEYDDHNRPVRIDAIVVSTQHDDFAKDDAMLAKLGSADLRLEYSLLWALARCGDEGSFAALMSARRQVGMTPERAVAELATLLPKTAKSPMVQRMALEMLRAWGDASRAAVVAAARQELPPGLRYAAAQGPAGSAPRCRAARCWVRSSCSTSSRR